MSSSKLILSIILKTTSKRLLRVDPIDDVDCVKEALDAIGWQSWSFQHLIANISWKVNTIETNATIGQKHQNKEKTDRGKQNAWCNISMDHDEGWSQALRFLDTIVIDRPPNSPSYWTQLLLTDH